MPSIENFQKIRGRIKSKAMLSNRNNTQHNNNIFDVLEELTTPYQQTAKPKAQSTLESPSLKPIVDVKLPLNGNLGQSQDKLETKLGQTEGIPKTNLGQSQDKLETKLGQTEGIPKTNLGQSQDKLETKVRTNKPLEIQKNTSFLSLMGVQKSLVLYIFQLCKQSCSRVTNATPIDNFLTYCKTTKFSAQKSLQRLEKKGVIIRSDFKNGRGGWTRYELSEQIFKELVTLENHNSNIFEFDKTSDKLETKLKTLDIPYSSSSLLNKTTTTMLEENNATFDLSPLANIGLSSQHVYQLVKLQKLNADQIQNSIYYFAFDLEQNDKAKTLKKSPLDFFMGILRQGIPYAAPGNYVSPEAKAMRLYLESKQRAIKMTQELENETMVSLYQEWQQSLTSEEIDAFWVDDGKLGNVPEKVHVTLKRRSALANAKEYFELHVWPLRRKEILEGKKE